MQNTGGKRPHYDDLAEGFHHHGYDSAWAPTVAGGRVAGLEENCIKDPGDTGEDENHTGHRCSYIQASTGGIEDRRRQASHEKGTSKPRKVYHHLLRVPRALPTRALGSTSLQKYASPLDDE
jgi:hypothetical protein